MAKAATVIDSMTKIIFACKSNSCRSQMAEGWAREWIRREREVLDQMTTLSSSGFDDPADWSNTSGAVSNDRRADEKGLSKNNSSGGESGGRFVRDEIQRRSAALDELVVTSVALDSSSVFECGTGTCCGDMCETPSQRKAVKENAVRAMAEDGVDISTFVPKTIEEIIPHLNKQGAMRNDAEKDASHPPKGVVGADNEESVVVAKIGPTSKGSVTMDEISATYSSTLFLSDEFDEDLQKNDPSLDTCKKPVDKLIVLCSCGDDVKRRLVRRSKSVEEWNIDAPTAAAKREGDGAYRRVSHEIRKEVDILFGSMVGDGMIGDPSIRRGLTFEEKKRL